MTHWIILNKTFQTAFLLIVLYFNSQGLYVTVVSEKHEAAHHLSLSQLLENSSSVHFPVRPPNKGSVCSQPAQMDTHAQTRTKKGFQPKPLSDFFFLPLLVLSQRARSQTRPDGSYSGPHGAGHVQNRATIILEGGKEG